LCTGVSMVGRKGVATLDFSYIRVGIIPAPRRDVVHGLVEARDDIFAGVLVELVQCRVEVGRFRHVVRMCVLSEEEKCEQVRSKYSKMNRRVEVLLLQVS